MSHSIAVAPVRTASESGMIFRWSFALALVGFVFLWLEVIFQLQSEWSFNPQYSYGWTVPFLAAWIFYQRWISRPTPEPSAWPGLTSTLIFLAAAILLPSRIIAVANPDWRLLSWTMALVAAVVSLGAIHLAGGRAWLRQFVFPVLFFLVAVPWPVQFEQPVIQSLMRADAAITIQLLNLVGTLAVQHGNVIELSTGQVGIDDACTGVRSLQATFMVALFLGEFYRLTIARRALLVLAGGLLAFVCNIGRTFLLCQIAAGSGLSAIHRWHDPAGYTILVVCLFVLWGLSLWLKRPAENPATPPQRHIAISSPRNTVLALALIVWLGLIEVAAAAWYSKSGGLTNNNAQWSVAWPTNKLDYRRYPLPEEVSTLMRFNEGGAATWRSSDGRDWMMYSFRWLPGRTAALFVKNHRPDICLPASGLTMQSQSEIRLVRINGLNLPLHFYRFDDNGRPLHVVYCYWDGRSSYDSNSAAAEEDWTMRGRLRSAREGKREVGARMLELAIWGEASDVEAQAALTHELEQIVRR